MVNSNSAIGSLPTLQTLHGMLALFEKIYYDYPRDNITWVMELRRVIQRILDIDPSWKLECIRAPAQFYHPSAFEGTSFALPRVHARDVASSR